MDSGWKGPPYDPVQLAEILGIALEARDDVKDARLVPMGSKYKIQFNPSRPRGRIYFSIAHEISHTYFPDAAEKVQNRAKVDDPDADWQVEMLCNIGAAELLMPIGSFIEIKDAPLSIEALLNLRKEFQVSAEAILIRYAKLSSARCAAFSASQHEVVGAATFKLDYLIGSASWPNLLQSGDSLSAEAGVQDCVAIGYTAKGVVRTSGGRLTVESVGLPPFPTTSAPRAAGLMWLAEGRRQDSDLRSVRGDALAPRGSGPKLLVQVVNDQTTTWAGRGFAAAVKAKWPEAQQAFSREVSSNRSALRLGAMTTILLQKDLTLACLVAQRGYGPSETPRIRYEALKRGLSAVADSAIALGASVHMPRIGTGNAGGAWEVVSELVRETLVKRGVEVTVYDLPS
jgi:O-acetyl-ADP-ribose deacetylase (regulator of RNase III)